LPGGRFPSTPAPRRQKTPDPLHHRRAKLPVVGRLLLGIQQADAGRRDLVQQTLRQAAVRTRLVGPQMRHLAVGRRCDHIGVGLEELDRQKPVMVGRLVLRRNAKPLVVRVKRFGHCTTPGAREITQSDGVIVARIGGDHKGGAEEASWPIPPAWEKAFRHRANYVIRETVDCEMLRMPNFFNSPMIRRLTRVIFALRIKRSSNRAA